MQSRIVSFYRGEGTDENGRTIYDIKDFDYKELEKCHNWIQWAFPLTEASAFNPNAPLLTQEDIAIIQNDGRIQENFQDMFNIFLDFLGFEPQSVDDSLKFVKAPHFYERARFVWNYPNHNWLRITRVLKCCKLFGHDDWAQWLLNTLKALSASGDAYDFSKSMKFWEDAVAS